MKRERKTLKELQKEHRYTIKEVAEGSGIPFSTYTAYSNGYRKLPLAAARRIADFYGISIDDIAVE